MASQDPHQGGDLYDMAQNGTSMPNDAGKMNSIPSVPRPGEGQATSDLTDTNANSEPFAAAATNATDIPRGTKDTGSTGEVETGTGDRIPATVESKRLHTTANNPAAKGHPRAEKHRQRADEFDSLANEGPGVDLQPSEDRIANSEAVNDNVVDGIVNDRERKEV